MERHLSLVEQKTPDLEKRVFPRFPFSTLVFKTRACDKRFEVVDISRTGMQLSLKDGGHPFRPEQRIEGEVHWRGRALKVSAQVEWIKGQRLGVSFELNEKKVLELEEFLSIEHIVSRLRCVHQGDFGLEIPANLKYWLQAEGPVELFVWRHTDGEISRFNLILFDEFVEWEDGKGLSTGRILQKRDMDTPLLSEDEFLFELDTEVDSRKCQFGQSVIEAIDEQMIPREGLDFLVRKLS